MRIGVQLRGMAERWISVSVCVFLLPDKKWTEDTGHMSVVALIVQRSSG